MNPFLQVLIVEDDADVAMACEQTMRLEGLDCVCVSSAEQAQKRLSTDFAGVVVSDIRLPQMSGLELLAAIRALDPELPVILITGHGDISMAVQAMKDGADDFLEKPFAPERLVESVGRALERRRLVLEVRSLRQQLQSRDVLQHQLLGRSLPMQLLRSTLQSLAASEADVLIWGETGTGKERVARSLHESSRRKSGNFVAINCGGLPETLFDSEMFGSEAGAFTGAGKKRIGKIEHASGGTLFLDEIESMPLAMQAKLLRVLQERVLERLGSNTLIPVDCRVIAATKVDLLELSRQGLFRSDLYYRLNVATVNLPPLRERREDVALLFEHFALQAAARHQRPVAELTPQRLQTLLAHDWPGNVRELRNAAERITLGLDAGISPPGAAPGAAASLASTMESIERSLISEALRNNEGNLTRTAQALHTPKTTLHDKIRKYGL
ncbi:MULTISPECIES: sigma-54-dependent transcriptional regulator [Comamonas]|jgi:two-component system C4-dicarboxylate transport response regulator DctD|uniref:sigma-54-dependent transcriptional regulator n=1 Tax=Comamonas TaxID=283 RepID=UPI0012C2549C|nr:MULTISPECIES: sigma-54 dependent transcriptional regulator [Comamonas]MDR3064899.1 sigma-54 dependent transcriptional regulator [Comamonas sp.]MEB5965305.1 sigma-54 dependent transcriptional regulator [Comamonas testosteroni]MPS94561.1 sigma-54-dependent Fis family transcriptional regulator [Comamonas sp.]